MQTYTNKARINTLCCALFEVISSFTQYDKLKSELCCKLATNNFSTLADGSSKFLLVVKPTFS